MSSRTLRKLKAERNELESSVVVEDFDDSDDLASKPRGNKNAKKNLFAFLDSADDVGGDDSNADKDEDKEAEDENEDDDNDDDVPVSESGKQSESKKKKKKKKKKSGKTATTQLADQKDSNTTKSAAKDKATEKKKEEEDDIDKIVAEINQKFQSKESLDGTKKNPEQLDTKKMALRFEELLTVDPKHLDPAAELRRIFGSRVLSLGSSEGRGRGGGGGGGGGGMIQRKLYNRAVRKTLLVKLKDTWPRFERLGMSMKSLGTDDASGCVEFAFEHSSWYQGIQIAFYRGVDSLDPNSIAELVRSYPYHVDSLLALSDISRHHGNIDQASDLIERALFTCEACFHPQFNLLSGKYLLRYARVENRMLFLAIFRHIQYLGRKGCWRTSFEFCKILGSLDPSDPLCSILLLDFYALRAKEHAWYYDLVLKFGEAKKLHLLPNVAMSKSLAKYRLECESGSENHDESDSLLQEALQRFPSVIPLLADLVGASSFNKSILENPFFVAQTPSELADAHLALFMLTKLYCERAFSLWKEPDVLAWLKSNASHVINQRQSDPYVCDQITNQLQDEVLVRYSTVKRSIYRHVFISDFGTVTALIPDSVLKASGPRVAGLMGVRTEYTGLNSHDPFPPCAPSSSSNQAAVRDSGIIEEDEKEDWIESPYDRLRQREMEEISDGNHLERVQQLLFQNNFANLPGELEALLRAAVGEGRRNGNNDDHDDHDDADELDNNNEELDEEYEDENELENGEGLATDDYEGVSGDGPNLENSEDVATAGSNASQASFMNMLTSSGGGILSMVQRFFVGNNDGSSSLSTGMGSSSSATHDTSSSSSGAIAGGWPEDQEDS